MKGYKNDDDTIKISSAASGTDKTKADRGVKIVQTFGRTNDYNTGSVEDQRYGEGLKGGMGDLSRSIKDGKVPSFP